MSVLGDALIVNEEDIVCLSIDVRLPEWFKACSCSLGRETERKVLRCRCLLVVTPMGQCQ